MINASKAAAGYPAGQGNRPEPFPNEYCTARFARGGRSGRADNVVDWDQWRLGSWGFPNGRRAVHLAVPGRH